MPSRFDTPSPVSFSVPPGESWGAMEQDATQRQGVEITVRLDSGALVAIVQDVEEPGFRPGDRVRVLSDGVMSRVAR